MEVKDKGRKDLDFHVLIFITFGGVLRKISVASENRNIDSAETKAWNYSFLSFYFCALVRKVFCRLQA